MHETIYKFEISLNSFNILVHFIPDDGFLDQKR